MMMAEKEEFVLEQHLVPKGNEPETKQSNGVEEKVFHIANAFDMYRKGVLEEIYSTSSCLSMSMHWCVISYHPMPLGPWFLIGFP